VARVEPFEKYTQLYEDWFEAHPYIYESEIKAIQSLLLPVKKSVEIGVGSGRFAVPLGIKYGLEPSTRMMEIVKKRGIKVVAGIAENLPFVEARFDLVLMVTTICFLDDLEKSFGEVHRVLKPQGWFIIGFIDKNSPVGKIYQMHKNKNVFYRIARFYSVKEVVQFLRKTGFGDFRFSQTIFRNLENITEMEPVKSGYGEGSFVVIRAQKQ